MYNSSIYELKKEVKTPFFTILVGVKKTKSEWLEIFPNVFDRPNYLEWFRDITPKPVTKNLSYLSIEERSVRKILKEKNKENLGIKQVCIECIEEYKRQIKSETK